MMEEKALIHASHNIQSTLAAGAMDIRDLEKSLRRPRSLFSFLMSALTTALTVLALVPLFSVLYMLLLKGVAGISTAWFTQLPPGPMEAGGGFGNAILGTLIMVGLATLMSVPLGIVAAVYLTEVGPETRLASVVRFGAKVLSGFPSILAGVLAYGTVVVATGHFSAIAGGVALAVLMLPTVILTAEDAIRMVPGRIREAAIGMGTTPTQAIWYVLLPTAMPGILTGVMLAVARAAGETAPLLFTALFSDYWPLSRGIPTVMEPTASLAVLIYNFSSRRSKTRLPWPGRPLWSWWSWSWRPISSAKASHGATNRSVTMVTNEPAAKTTALHGARRPPRRPRTDNDAVIDCDIKELYYGNFKAVRDTGCPSRRARSPPSSAPRAAARARCSAA